MANLDDLVTRMSLTFSQATIEQMTAWIVESSKRHKFTSVEVIPEKAEEAVLSYAKYFGMTAKSVENADKGSISIPGKVDINRSQVSQNYQRIISQVWREYRSEAVNAGLRVVGMVSSTSSIIRRPDGR